MVVGGRDAVGVREVEPVAHPERLTAASSLRNDGEVAKRSYGFLPGPWNFGAGGFGAAPNGFAGRDGFGRCSAVDAGGGFARGAGGNVAAGGGIGCGTTGAGGTAGTAGVAAGCLFGLESCRR